MKGRLRYLLTVYAATVGLFIAAKAGFMLACGRGHGVTWADSLQVVGHGLSLDLSTALYVLLVPFLISLASVWVKVPRWVAGVYYGLVAMAFVADTSLYPFWGFKLDASCLQYLATPAEATASVSTGFLVVRLLLVVAIAIGVFFIYWRIALPRRGGHWWESLVHLLLVPAIVVGLRGGLGESTTNIGQVYFSQNQFLNHAAVNSVFSFLSSIGKTGNYVVSYDYFDDAELAHLTDGLYDTQSIDPDTLLTTRRPNILLIIMESCGGQFTFLGGDSVTMPRLNRLCREGVFFAECYANSWRTDRGTVSILSGYPAFPTTSVMKIPEKSRKLPSIAATLKGQGYCCSFYYGGDINFTNMRSYVMSSGYERLTWKADYSLQEQATAEWGVRDDVTFDRLYNDIVSEKENPWMKTMLTLSSHEPWDVPTQRLDDPVHNAFNYLDECLGDFIERLKQTSEWNDLLIILVPDHGLRYQGIDETTRLYNHLPMLWTGGAVKEARTVKAVCNQSDLPATLLGQMGLTHDAFTFSRDVMSKSYRQPFAYHTFTNGVTVIDSTGFMAYDLGAQQLMACEGPDSSRLLQLGQAMLQLSSHDLKDK